MSTLMELVYYCKEVNSFGALMLTGKWGCGKTYLIDKELPNELGDEYIIIRTSLFGESSIDGINKKVQKAYFHNVLLHMGNCIQDGVQCIGVSEDAAKKAVSSANGRINDKKLGGILGFARDIAKNVPGVDKILSISPSDYISVEKTIADKKVVLVFDDLERTNLSEIDVLGCINEYCENKQIKTIIVANEDRILEKNQQVASSDTAKKNEVEDTSIGQQKDNKIRYSEIKEKIVTRTIKHFPDYNNIIKQIIDEFNSNTPEYKNFLEAHKEDLINVFNMAKINNIRSIKCAIQDFQRLFKELQSKGVEDDLEKYFQTFVAFVLQYKEGKINKSEPYGYMFSDYQIEKEYPGLFVNRYMLSSVKRWIVEGEWIIEDISNEITKIIDAKKAVQPKEIVRNSDLVSLDEEIIRVGLPEVLSLAYEGELFIDEYILLLQNILWARKLTYNLPAVVDMNKMKKGASRCLQKLKDSDEPYTNIRRGIHSDSLKLLTEEEREVYQEMCDFRDNNVQMFEINKRKYLRALSSKSLSDLYECENKRFNIFDEEMANAVMSHYKDLPNANRHVFNNIFNKMWGCKINSQDLRKSESLSGFYKLRDMLKDTQEQEKNNNYDLRAALTNILIQDLDKIIGEIECIIEKEVEYGAQGI